MEKKTYKEKLKDPRWQKMRLKILERDDWTCQYCQNTENTLNVHHFYYYKGREPWEYETGTFVTLCDGCHEEEKAIRPGVESDLLELIRLHGFSANDVVQISYGFNALNSKYPPEVTAEIIEFALSNDEMWTFIAEMYFENCRKIANERA